MTNTQAFRIIFALLFTSSQMLRSKATRSDQRLKQKWTDNCKDEHLFRILFLITITTLWFFGFGTRLKVAKTSGSSFDLCLWRLVMSLSLSCAICRSIVSGHRVNEHWKEPKTQADERASAVLFINYRFRHRPRSPQFLSVPFSKCVQLSLYRV